MGDQQPPASNPYWWQEPPPTNQAAEGFPRYGDYKNTKRDVPSKAMAVWALVLACIPMFLAWIIAIVLALVVLTSPKDGYDRGRGLAIAALVIAPMWIVAFILYVALGLLSA
jgi:ABC-type sugar transport system permease subunit